MNPVFSVVKNTDTLLVIRDECEQYNATSITNGAENVIERLYEMGLLVSGKQCLYYDTMDQLDELVHADGVFVGFKPGPKELPS